MFSMRNVNTNNEILKIEVMYLQTIESFTIEINKQSLMNNKLIEFQTPNELFEQLQQHSDSIKCLQNGLITFVLKWGKITRVKQIQTIKTLISFESILLRTKQLKNNQKLYKININQLNAKNQLLQKQNFSLKQQMKQIKNQIQKNNQREIKQIGIGIIYGHYYLRCGQTQLKGQYEFYLQQGPTTTKSNYYNKEKLIWTFIEMIDGQLVLLSNNKQILSASSMRTLQNRQKIQAQQRWRRIKAVGNKSMWLSCYNTYLSVNKKGELYLQDTQIMAPESLWADTIDK